MAAKLEKASLSVVGTMSSTQGKMNAKAGSGGIAGGVEVGASCNFQFNPKEYTIQRSANVPRQSTPSAKGSSPPQYTGPEPRSMSFEAFFDESETQTSVAKKVDFLLDCCVATPKSRQDRKPALPVVSFQWGSSPPFKGVVKSVNAKYTLFTSEGVPIRAACTVNLEEYTEPEGGQNPTSGGRTARRSHRVVAGDSLPSIAYEEYGEPGLWRAIAELNGVDDPMRLPSGLQLLVPEADEARARS